MSVTTPFVPGPLSAAALNGLLAAWDVYTPTLTAGGGNPTLGNSTLVGKFYRQGKAVHYRTTLTVGSTFSGGSGNWAFTLPAAPHADYTANMTIGWGLAFDASVPAWLPLTAGHVTSTAFLITPTGGTVSGTVPWTWTTGDQLSIGGTYEAA